MQDDKLIWQENWRKAIGDYRIFSIDAIERSSSDGHSNTFFSINSPPWVMVIALHEVAGEQQVVMVRQFRHGVGKITCEFPAGLVDAGESPHDAARRELAEECAYSAGNMVHIGSNNPNPALFANQMHIFLATQLSPLPRQQLDADERLEVLSLPLAELKQQLGHGEFDHALLLMAWFWYQKYCQSMDS